MMPDRDDSRRDGTPRLWGQGIRVTKDNLGFIFENLPVSMWPPDPRPGQMFVLFVVDPKRKHPMFALGDWLIRHPDGEVAICRADRFDRFYRILGNERPDALSDIEPV